MSTTPGRELSSNGSNFVKTVRHDTYPFIDPRKLDMSGLNVLVTGVSKGVGKAIAFSYAKAGVSNLVIAARSDLSSVASELQAAARGAGRESLRVIPLTLDVCSQASVEAAAQSVASQLGHLDVILHAAGLMEYWLPICDSEPSTWWSTWETNIMGTYLVLRSFLPLLIASPRPHKTLVTLTSGGALVTRPGASAYQTTKLAQIRLMEFVNVDYGDKGVCAYAVHPGGVKSEMSLKMPDWMHGVLVDTAELPGDALVWLTSARREWLNGRYVSANWDMEELMAKREEIVQGELLKVRMAVEVP